MELDHVFMFVEPGGAELAYLRSIGLSETYRRKHPGQGTENICFCFENIFLECIWVTNTAEIRSAAIARTGLYERSQWRVLGTSPFGFAWREPAAAMPASIPVWPFTPPYLPPGMVIDVAVESDDPRQPMVFKSPGGAPPSAWPAARRGNLQAGAGLGRVLSAGLRLPRGAAAGPALAALAAGSILDILPGDAEGTSLSLLVERSGLGGTLEIALPHGARG